ncbi:MAG TPA: two-component regulator propeller domain-containing protein [Sediminibacterium sp.]
MKHLLLLVACCFLYAGGVSAQQGFTFNRISTEDGIGLASNVVYSTYQDAKGFIWIGTANGLQRFDGSKFIQYNTSSDNSAALPISDLTQILPAGNNSLWLCFSSKGEFGLFNLSTFQYTTVPIKPLRQVLPGAGFRLWKDSRGEVFLTIFRYGILHYDKKANAFIDDNYFQLPFDWTPTLGHYEDTVTHRYWFPCYNFGMAVYDAKDRRLYTSKNNPRNIPLLNNKKVAVGTSEIFIDSKRRHWIMCWSDAQYKYCFDANGKQLNLSDGLGQNPEYAELSHFFETSRRVLWIYGANALYNLDNDANRFFFYQHAPASPTGIEFQFVYQVMEDHDGNIWVATDHGLYFASTESGTSAVVNMLFPPDKTGGVEFTDILELKTGQIWLSTWGKGIFTHNKNMVRYDAGIYDHIPPMDDVSWIQYRQVWTLYQQADGKVWIGCQGGHYIIHDPITKTSQFRSDPVFKGSTLQYITGDKAGNIWIGTLKGDLIKYDGRKFSLMQEFGSQIEKILIDNEGSIWVAPINRGLYCLSADGVRVIQRYTTAAKQNPLFMNSGRDMDQLNDSVIVFGGGAMNFVNKRTHEVQWLTFNDGLPSNTIQRIRVDSAGYLWMITRNGLCRYNPITKRVTPYGRKEGITVSHFTDDADYFTSTGKVIFAGANAVLIFKPAIFQNRRPANVTITDFKIFNTYIRVDSLLNLPRVQLVSNQNSFSIYYAALSYAERDKLTFYYKMSGIDKGWVKADRLGYINYSLLPPGHYTFSVYCEDIDGTRSPDVTSIRIYIKPPFWRTYWFLGSMLLLVALIVYSFHHLRVKRLLDLEKLRMRVARDLHDDMGSTLSTINILSSMAKTKLGSDAVKTGEYLGKIGDNSQRMMEAMDDIVWSIKPTNDSMQKIAARMREFATNVLEAKEIELDFRMDEAVFDVVLNMEARRDFFLVFKEAVNNAAKYSNASMVVIRVGMHNKRLVLLVEDNGAGFNPEEADNGNGLGNMRKRAAAMNGRILIVSSPGEGAHITLNIPVGR